MKDDVSSSKKTPLMPDMDFVKFALSQTPESFTEDTPLEPIKFFCKDCKTFTDVEKLTKGLKFRCKKCKSDQVSFGTEKSLAHFYHVS